ncbi:xanthine dehydrogenase family protein molybdopterin-binding subunit [Candidatus Entotheonella palauensis]|uniref:xanthine dehydrogenase family protein molybdopterin-binding subunit n=1 Tax=Candidatus Entotheonella palauensis TaxID=93172 RepID=UPI0015C492F9|nr:xanthine dehydrogenase family protein molybdopterin-binding subunit [Candidatus Entotheonella palauensis]
MQTVGTSVPRLDAVDKVTGRATYTGDIQLPGMAYAKVLSSPLPHARITSINTAEARQLPGVTAVLTPDQLHDIDPYYGNTVKDRPILAIDKVRYQGEPVAAVVAVDERTAERAVNLIQATYEELPVAADIDAALAEDAPMLHASNICHEYHYDWGDAEAGFAESDHVFEDTFTFPMVYHYALEPHTAIAHYTPQGITVWTSAQHPFQVRAELARIFDIPLQRVQIIVPYVGGGFGSKSYTKIEPLAVCLSRAAGRPVRLALTVEEAFKTTRRHAARCTIKTGVMQDGTFVARHCRVDLDTGAYAVNGPLVCQRAGDRIPGPYHFPHLRVDSYAVYTNTTPAGSFRSIGAPQAAWASESQVDMIAAALGMDPLALRLKNLVAKGEEVRRGMRPLDGSPVEGMQRAAEAIGWGEAQAQTPGVKRGKGLGCNVSNVGSVPSSTAIVRMHADGSLTVMVGTTEIGQGSRVVLAQVAAEVLGIPLERVQVVASDTSIVPYDRSTGSSRSTTLMGLAVQGAAQDVQAQLLELAAQHFNSRSEALEIRNGQVHHQNASVTFSSLIQEEFGRGAGELIGKGYVSPRRNDGQLMQSPVFWEIGIAAVEVEVDETTGVLRLPQYVSVADVGKAIHPQQCEGQDEGAVMQGIGHTRFEAMHYEAGHLLNPNLIDYRVPVFSDLPDHFHSMLIENEDGPGPFGAKGLGEGGIVAAAPAIANAIYQATGVRIKTLPLTPERVWRALRDR